MKGTAATDCKITTKASDSRLKPATAACSAASAEFPPPRHSPSASLYTLRLCGSLHTPGPCEREWHTGACSHNPPPTGHMPRIATAHTAVPHQRSVGDTFLPLMALGISTCDPRLRPLAWRTAVVLWRCFNITRRFLMSAFSAGEVHKAALS